MSAKCPPLKQPWHWFPVEANDCTEPSGDIAFANGDLATGDGLKSLILMQLSTDKRRDGQRGWWGDYAMPFEIGSYLWTLQRRSRDADTLLDAERHVRDAIDPLINQGIAADYEVDVAYVARTLHITVTLFDRAGNALADNTVSRVL